MIKRRAPRYNPACDMQIVVPLPEGGARGQRQQHRYSHAGEVSYRSGMEGNASRQSCAMHGLVIHSMEYGALFCLGGRYI